MDVGRQVGAEWLDSELLPAVLSGAASSFLYKSKTGQAHVCEGGKRDSGKRNKSEPRTG